METAYVTLYTWEWKPIGQVQLDLKPLCHDGSIDRAELDDAAQKAALPLLRDLSVRDIHVFVHMGDPGTPEELLEAAQAQYASHGPDSESWDRNRRIRRPGKIDPKALR